MDACLLAYHLSVMKLYRMHQDTHECSLDFLQDHVRFSFTKQDGIFIVDKKFLLYPKINTISHKI